MKNKYPCLAALLFMFSIVNAASCGEAPELQYFQSVIGKAQNESPVISREAEEAQPPAYDIKPLFNEKDQAEVLRVTDTYVQKGISYGEALAKAIEDFRKAKETPLEKELRALGCVRHDLREITPQVLERVKLFHYPDKGPFILKPGLTLLYLGDIR